MMIISFNLKTFWKFVQIRTEHFKALVASPQTENQFYLFHLLWIGIGKLHQQERRQDHNLRIYRKKISNGHICSTSLVKHYNIVVTEYVTLSWLEIHLSLSHTQLHRVCRHWFGVLRGNYLADSWDGSGDVMTIHCTKPWCSAKTTTAVL